jgi:hypothetical protein
VRHPGAQSHHPSCSRPATASADYRDLEEAAEPFAALVLAVDEVATNSLRHGGGRGTLRIWRDADAVVCEVRDAAAGCEWSTSCATWSSCAPFPPGRWCGCTCTWVDSTATPPHVGGVAGGVACYWASIGRTLAAWGPLGPWATSNSTVWPSFSER